MNFSLRVLFALVIAIIFAAPAAAQQAPSFAKQVKPFLTRYCSECHNAEKPKGDLDVTTIKALMKGGENGAAVVPGKPDESRLVTQVEKKIKPPMPPAKARQPKPEEIGILRAWVAAGAKDDTVATTVTLPPIRSRVAAAPPVTALAYRPDGKLLAAAGHKEVFLIDPATGTIAERLIGQGTSVTALAFSRDGQRLAVASGTTGTAGEVRLHVFRGGQLVAKPEHLIAAHADIVHAVAFSPDGKTLATTGYDRLIKLWDVTTGKEVRTLKDHSDTVYGLAFSPDGKWLASAAADRAVKVWDLANGRRLYTLGDSTDWLYALAWSPDGKQLAAGGVDKSIRVWQADGDGGKLIHSVFAHEGPVLRLAYSADGKTLYSLGEDRIIKAWNTANMGERHVFAAQPETALALAVRPDQKQLALGRYDGALVLLDEGTGKVQSQPLPTRADPFPTVPKQSGNDTPRTAQTIALSVSIVGSIERAGAVDFYRFDAKEGQEVGVQAIAGDPAKLASILELCDDRGRVVAESTSGVLGHTCSRAGAYILSIRDRDYRGGGLAYRLHVGELPVVSSLFPLGVPRGTETEVHLEGVHLGQAKTMKVKVAADAVPGSRLPLTVNTPLGPALGNPVVVVGEFAEVVRSSTEATPQTVSVPGTGNGRIVQPGASETWRFAAKKGQRLIVEVHARRIGSPLDSDIEILDAQGKPVQRATLRCLAKCFTTFRDHDSASPGIRLEAWNELAVNDHVFLSSELLRIRTLPRNPDDDCQFFSVAGQRTGFLDTTSTHHSNGSPLYKVTIHPPGTTFPANGMPVIPIYYRNDDGGPGYGKDSRLFFDAPADGEYQVRIRDARGQGGSGYSYRLTIRPPRPSFQVRFNPTAPAVWKGGAVPVTVTADRIDSFDDAISLRLENLPPGFHAPATTIPPGEESTAFALYAEANAPAITNKKALKLIAAARIDGKDMVHTVVGGVPQLLEPGDIVTTTEQTEAIVQPGKEVRVTVKIERRNGFKGRVPLEVRGLPHGVRVLDVGLNGILVTEQDSSRTFVIYAEPWMSPTEHPFVVLARREGKNTEHAAKSLLLRVTALEPRKP